MCYYLPKEPFTSTLNEERIMRILVIEDDKKMSDIIQRGLTEVGYAVDVAYDGIDGEGLAKTVPYDLIILDIVLPQKDGIKISLELRREKINSRIIMLTCKDTISDRVKGLDSGADDYLVKPFAFDELLARIRALLRREISDGSHTIQVGELSLNTLTREIKRGQNDIKLTSKEYSLMEYFMRNPNVVVTRRMLEDHVWNFSMEFESNLVDVYIRRLRRKIDEGSKDSLIETIRGAGYRLKPNENFS
jgi:DNA-binding response OmpR family regulator